MSATLAMATVSPDSDAAITFLRDMQPNDLWVLTAIEPDGRGIETRTYGPGQGRMPTIGLRGSMAAGTFTGCRMRRAMR